MSVAPITATASAPGRGPCVRRPCSSGTARATASTPTSAPDSGITYDAGYAYRSSSPAGFALAGGLSYDARLTPWFAISPEFFVTWHQIPNPPGTPDDVSSIYGVRLNLLWYLH